MHKQQGNSRANILKASFFLTFVPFTFFTLVFFLEIFFVTTTVFFSFFNTKTLHQTSFHLDSVFLFFPVTCIKPVSRPIRSLDPATGAAVSSSSSSGFASSPPIVVTVPRDSIQNADFLQSPSALFVFVMYDGDSCRLRRVLVMSSLMVPHQFGSRHRAPAVHVRVRCCRTGVRRNTETNATTNTLFLM